MYNTFFQHSPNVPFFGPSGARLIPRHGSFAPSLRHQVEMTQVKRQYFYLADCNGKILQFFTTITQF